MSSGLAETASNKPGSSTPTKRKRPEATENALINLTEDDIGDTPQCATPKKRPHKSLARLSDQSPVPSSSTVEAGSSRVTTLAINTRSPLNSTQSTPGSRVDGAGTLVASTQPGHGLPTAVETLEMKEDLFKIPELADRYVPRTLIEGVEYTNPQKFSIKPAFWKKWKARQYALLAEDMRFQFDPVPFSKATGLPIGEVRQVFSVIVCNPLYDAKEATRRGGEGMFEMMEFYQKYGTPNRPWSKDGKGAQRVAGELHRITAGLVEIILENGSKHTMKVNDLSVGDSKYLQETLTLKDQRMLWQDQ